MKRIKGQATTVAILLVMTLLALASWALANQAKKAGRLELTFVDEDGQTVIPVRVEIVNIASGRGEISHKDALRVGMRDVFDREDMSKPLSPKESATFVKNKIWNPFYKQTQFYSLGTTKVGLYVGDYTLRVFRGAEYKTYEDKFTIEDGKTLEKTIKMSRWINMSQKGWYSADSHIHVARPSREDNKPIIQWMQAEDLNVANLLFMGTSVHFSTFEQYQFGPEGAYQEGNYILAAGQENPRTHMVGHMVVLGATEPIHYPDSYMLYRKVFEKALQLGGLPGYAHKGIGRGATEGVAVMDHTLSRFMEVIQFSEVDYTWWYALLNLGYQFPPIAGTDYPFNGYPGRDRFYTKVEQPFNYVNWLAAVEAGKTFASSGPMIFFTVDGKDIGSKITKDPSETITLKARVKFDPTRHDVTELRLVMNGEVIKTVKRQGNSDEISVTLDHTVKETCWVSARAVGMRLGEVKIWNGRRGPATAEAHAGAVYVTVKGSRPLIEQARAQQEFENIFELLDKLEINLTDAKIKAMFSPEDEKPAIYQGRAALLEEIAARRAFFVSKWQAEWVPVKKAAKLTISAK